MLLLDTDHVVEFQKGTSPAAHRLESRLNDAQEPVATLIISVEEITRGWMAEIRRKNQPHDSIVPYAKFQEVFEFFAEWNVIEWNEAAVERFSSLRKDHVRVRTMDMKIASIALANNATLLTANTVDFEKVPGSSLRRLAIVVFPHHFGDFQWAKSASV